MLQIDNNYKMRFIAKYALLTSIEFVKYNNYTWCFINAVDCIIGLS